MHGMALKVPGHNTHLYMYVKPILVDEYIIRF